MLLKQLLVFTEAHPDNVLDLLATRVFGAHPEVLLTERSVLLGVAQIVSCQRPALRSTKALYEPAEEAVHGSDGRPASFVLRLGCPWLAHSVDVAQEDRPCEERSAQRPATADGTGVARAGP